MNAILGVYTKLDEVTNLQCDYLETLGKYEFLEKELSKSKMMSKSFEALQKHAINLELDLQQSQLQDKEIALSELKKLIEKLKGKSVETKFEKSSVIRQPNAFKSQRPSILGKPTIFSDSLEKKDCSKSKSVTKNNVSNDFSKPVTAQILPPNNKSIVKNTNLIEIILVIVDSGCSKHMTRNLKLLTNFVEKFLGSVKFGNDQIAPILGYGDLVQGTVTIKRVYYVEGLNHNLFSVGQFCDANLEVAFWKSTCYICDLKGNDLLIGIQHQTSVARTPEQNGAEVIATSCFTQNHSLVIPRHEKTPYYIINDRKPSVKFFYIFGSLFYIVRDSENLDKIREKGDACIFVGYSAQSRAYRVFNKRIRVIVETIHVNFDELPQMALDHVSSDPVPQCERTALKHDSLSPGP
nr:integrase, catalytic region, zinc finger, CCHC-type, peptidase aspartic, catalytic [Tanacetum cinerariifolium]